MLSCMTHAQTRKIIVSPNLEVIPMGKESGERIMQRHNAEQARRFLTDCGTKPIYGFDPERHPEIYWFGVHHLEVCGEWFVIPVDGTIDTVYFNTGPDVGPDPVLVPGSMDSTVIFRIFTSYITPTQGPGIRPGPYRPPCTSWGYWVNTNDQDQGVAAFLEDATDTAWVPTNLLFGDAAPSFPPFGPSIWGLQGFPVHKIKPNALIKVAMEDLAPLEVHEGDVIFISFKIPSSIHLDLATQDVQFSIAAGDQGAPYPSRNWKFYEHDSGPSNCAGVNRLRIKRGWVPRGPLGTDDTLSPSCYDIWYAMTPSSNTAPRVIQIDQLNNTFSEPQTFTTQILDCDAENTARAGVREAWFRYSFDNGKTWTTSELQCDGGTQYEGTIPGPAPTTLVQYRVIAEDSTGATDSSETLSYRVVGLDSDGWYRCDTSSICTPAYIAGKGTVIDTSQWFLDPHAFLGSSIPHRGDDGTAGPFSLGGPFVFYGDTMLYAWVGVNGAIALSKTATDTIDVNSDGFATESWDLPFTQHHNRADTLNVLNTPKALIAPYWADWINKVDSPVATLGKVRTFSDTGKFVVEWDSLGMFDPNFWWIGDIEAFRVVLNKTDNSIEFQYDDIGIDGLDTSNLVGIQCDSNYHPQPVGQYPPYAYYNRLGFPSETHLHNGLCIHYVPVLGQVATFDGWNLLSIAGQYQNSARSFLFPTATSQAFAYNNGYVVAPSMINGPGYWLKFSGAQNQQILGRALTHLDINVNSAWNMIGSITAPVPVANVTADAATGIGPGSIFYYYTSIGGYQIESTIRPGVGYWVRADGAGQVHLNSSGAPKVSTALAEVSTLNKITISEKSNQAQTLYIGSGSVDPSKYEMPPRAPDGALDVRFASNRLVETYPAVLDESKKYEYPIVISATQYPLTVRWQAPKGINDPHTLTLKTQDGKVLAMMTGSGKITLNDASIKGLVITVSSGVAVPKVFSLSRNYPNPFNPTTRFTVAVPRISVMDVSVYDVLGRKIATVWNGEQTAGYHTMEWDGRDGQGITVPTGMYFIRASAPVEQFSATQKILLMK